jgi:hypothetical protein
MIYILEKGIWMVYIMHTERVFHVAEKSHDKDQTEYNASRRH